MKKLILITLIAVPCAFAQADPFAGAKKNPDKKLETAQKENVFNVSKANASTANKEMFLKLWDALVNPRFEPGTKKMMMRIKQSAGKEGDFFRYLATELHYSGEYSSEFRSVLLTKGDLVDGGGHIGWFNPAGFYEYDSVAGSNRRVAQFKEAVSKPDPNAPTKEDFVTKLKAGETFTVMILEEQKKCQPCFGAGKLGSLQGGGDCKDCRGKGFNEVLETWVLKW